MKTVAGNSNSVRWQSLFFVAAFIAMAACNETILTAFGDSSSAARAIIITVKYDILSQWDKIAAAPAQASDEAM
jgi:hypothetical protein